MPTPTLGTDHFPVPASGELCVSGGRLKEAICRRKRMKQPEKVATVQRASMDREARRNNSGVSWANWAAELPARATDWT
nr:hypothetical protein [Pseudomonas sp. Q1-7]